MVHLALGACNAQQEGSAFIYQAHLDQHQNESSGEEAH